MLFLKSSSSSKRHTTEQGGNNPLDVKISSLVDTDDYDGGSYTGGSVKTTDKMKNMMKKKTKSLKIFRRKESSKKKSDSSSSTISPYYAPPIQPGLTWTNSEDSSISGDSSFANGSMTQHEIHDGNASTTTLLIPSASFINNEWHEHVVPSKGRLQHLMAKHKTEMEEKKVEIELMQDQIVVLNERNMEKNLVIDSMKEQHKLAMHEKIMEMKSMQTRMVIMKNQHEEEYQILESALREKEDEIIDLTANLNCTKADLFEVSSSLIQTQHKLHDLSTAWPYKFFF